MNWGGKREGAGARPKGDEKRIQRNINLTPTVWKFLEAQAQQGETVNDVLERLCRALLNQR